MEKYNKLLGNFGERSAEGYLIKNKYKIIDRNYRCKFGEIDIVALEKDNLVFIEVKTRTTEKYGNPSDAINFIKKKHMTKTALNYISHKKMEKYFCRFDVVEVFAEIADSDFRVVDIKIIKNALI
jgi:putative endonuclease